MVCVYKDKIRKYISVGVSVHSHNWDFNKNQPKVNCPNRELILKIMNEQVNKYTEKILSFKAEYEDFTVNSLINSTDTAANKISINGTFD